MKISMHPLRKRRLFWISIIVLLVASAIALALFALRQNVNLFFTPSQISPHQLQKDQTIRVGGWVMANSVHHANNTLQVSFIITDHKANLPIRYEGILPDLFREGQAVVVEGTLNAQGTLIASQVLAKHDENYTPPELK